MNEFLALIQNNLLETGVIIAFITAIAGWIKGKLDLRIANAKIDSDERLKFYSDLTKEFHTTRSQVIELQSQRSTERFEVERLKILVYKLHNEVKDLIGICDRHGIKFTRRSDDGYIEEVLGIRPSIPPADDEQNT